MDQMPTYSAQQRGPGGAVVPAGYGMGVPTEYRYDGNPYPNYPTETMLEPQGFDFYKYLRIAVKYRWLIVGATLTALLLAAVLTFLMTPVYRSAASIQIDREAINVTGNDGLQPKEVNSGLEFYQTQYELLASRSLAERVVSTLNLAGDYGLVTQKSPSLFSTLKVLVMGSDPTPAKELTIEEKNTQVVETLLRSLTIAPVRGSRVVKINIDNTDPALAQRVANGYAEVFIADNLDRRYDASSYARKFLEERIQQLKVRLEDSERQLVKYAEDQGLINLDDNKTLAGTDLEAINIRLSEARNERLKLELLWQQAQQTNGLGLQQILDSDAIKANRKLRTELAAEYQQKLGIYKPAFPAMIQLRNQIKELDRQVESEVQSIKDSIQSQFEASKGQEEDLLGQLEQTKTEVVDQRGRSIQYNILQREVDTNRTLYDGLLQRYKEIGVSGAVGTNNISIVDRATLPVGPRSPNLISNLAIAFVLGLLTGVLTALGLDYLDDTFKSPEDIEQQLGMSVIGIVPKPRPGTTIDEEMFEPRSGAAEAIRSLRTGLQFATSDGLPRTLVITSSKPSEGKTTTTIALAKSLADLGMNVLLIDGDLRNASIHKRVRCSNELGLSNYLTGSKMPEEVVQDIGINRLVVMTSGPLPPNPAELLAGPKMLSLLTLGAESFDVVLIDGPPVMGLADAPLLASIAQATLLVVAANETRRSVVKVAVRRLRYAKANIIGALLSKFDASQTGYGYGYGDYEYHSYGVKELSASGSQ
jgi:polysaccharide biosynthesis transport protein